MDTAWAMECSGVYQIKNISTGSIYIGSSKRIKKRFAEHKSALSKNKHQNRHLQASWNKHGVHNFTYTVLLVCGMQQMRYYEQLLIDAMEPQYNQSKSAFAGVPLGSKITDKHKAKVAVASKAQWADSGYREKVTKAINAAMTEKECLARQERTKVLWADPEYRAKAIAARKGNAYCKGYKCTPEQILNRKKAARISNMKRNYGDQWKDEYVRRYPEHAGDINGI